MSKDKKNATNSDDFIGEKQQCWKDKKFVEELDRRYKALENGKDKGFTIKELVASIEKRKSR